MRMYALILLICSVISKGVWCEAPVITVPHPQQFIRYPEYPHELVVHEGNSFHLRCEHSARVNFSLPSFNNHYGEVWTANITSGYNQSENVHTVDLIVTNSPHLGTGYIYCKNEYATSTDDHENTSSVFVYIRGDSNIVILDTLFLYPLQSNDSVVVPCRSTSPDVDVVLELTNGKTDVNSSMYDPRVGITVLNLDEVVELELSEDFECNATRKEDGMTQSVQGVIRLLAARDSVEKPLINSTQSLYNAGDHMTLQCIVIVDGDTYFELYWELPESIQKSGDKRVIYHNTTVSTRADDFGTFKKFGSVLVSIDPVRPSDSGEYRCVIKDHNGNKAFTAKNVSIFR